MLEGVLRMPAYPGSDERGQGMVGFRGVGLGFRVWSLGLYFRGPVQCHFWDGGIQRDVLMGGSLLGGGFHLLC